MTGQNHWIFGSSSSIIRPILDRYPNANTVNREHLFFQDPSCILNDLLKTENLKIIYNSATLLDKQAADQSDTEIINTLFVSVIRFVQIIELINRKNKCFKAIYIGSEVAIKGSYDTTYWMAKSFGERFVSEVKLQNHQSSIIALSPSTIEDSAMTTSRLDKERVDTYRSSHPKKRFLDSAEVSSMIVSLLNAGDYLSNTTISLNGGKFARR